MITLRQTIPQKPERPRGETGKELISVRGLLEWAFGVEFASLEYDWLDEFTGGYPSKSIVAVIGEQLALGDEPGVGVRVDTSIGRSLPHDDAEIVAAVLRMAVPWSQAVRVAEFSAAFSLPKWDLGAQRIEPREWSRENQSGARGKTEVCRVVKYRSRGRIRERKDFWVPCRWVPTASQIAKARREYLDWWGALLAVQAGLNGVELQRFEMTSQLPPMQPWRKSA